MIFTRKAIKGETKIKPHIFGSKSKTTKRILGFDQCRQYGTCLGKLQPVGHIIRRKEPNFLPSKCHKAERAQEWLI